MSTRYVLQAGVWLIFLTLFITDVSNSDHSTVIKTTSYALTALFIAVYLLSMMMLRHPARRIRIDVVAWVVVLLAITVTIGWLTRLPSTATFVPYIIAVILYKLEWRMVIPTTITLLIALPLLIVGLINDDYGPITLAIVVMVIIAGRYGVEVDFVRRDVEQQLAIVQERERVARDVHDVLGHSLTVINLKSELARKLIDHDPEQARREIEAVAELSRSALGEARATVTHLRTPDLARELVSAAEALATASIRATVPAPHHATRIPDDTSRVFAWALKEAVTNVIRHSGATHCVVELAPSRLVVRDDGRGFRSTHRGNGLGGLEARVAVSGGTLTITSDSSGTELNITMDTP